MNYQDSLQYLYSLQKSGIKFGLENTLRILKYLGNPHKNFKSIHIAGTNGKGSTSLYVALVLAEMNFRVGLYTSPHLVRFNERIIVDGKEIPDNYLIESVVRLKDIIEEIKPTFFEVTTAIAFKYFSDQKVDYAVIETGMGGRLDSTNVIDPEISVITRIDLDHKEYLGDSIEKIAFEKGGIIKKDTPVIVAKNENIVKETLKKISKEKKSKIIFVEDNYQGTIVNQTPFYSSFTIISKLSKKNYEVQTKLVGDYQLENVNTAIAVFENLFPERDLRDQIKNGISSERFKILGRFQTLNSRPMIILDTAHNSNAINNFLTSLNKIIKVPKNAVFGVMKDKYIDDSIELIKNSFDKIYLCRARTERSFDVDLLAEKFSSEKIAKCNSVDNAVERALQNTNPDFAIVIFGSNYIAGEAIEFLKSKNFM